ncbi:MAG: hypothetical protein OK454_04580, partial [Thaumarchaeota archaeon]|nr:hypothetical protein [Nitrososphaerota archaeon]
LPLSVCRVALSVLRMLARLSLQILAGRSACRRYPTLSSSMIVLCVCCSSSRTGMQETAQGTSGVEVNNTEGDMLEN